MHYGAPSILHIWRLRAKFWSALYPAKSCGGKKTSGGPHLTWGRKGDWKKNVSLTSGSHDMMVANMATLTLRIASAASILSWNASYVLWGCQYGDSAYLFFFFLQAATLLILFLLLSMALFVKARDVFVLFQFNRDPNLPFIVFFFARISCL